MTEPQRYKIGSQPGDLYAQSDGEMVFYADARAWVEREVQEAEQRWADDPGPLAAHYAKGAADERERGYLDGHKDGHAAGIQAARDAVAALDHYRVLECDPGLMHGKRDDPDPWSQGYLVYSDDALAAIDALKGEQA